MDDIAQAAIDHLETVIQGYLPSVTDASIIRDLMVIPKHIKPSGIGGYVGKHDNPAADVHARLLEAQAEIRVSDNSSDLDAINNEISGLTSALLTTDRETLRSDGIFKLNLQSLSPPDGSSQNARIAVFEICCEHQLIPTEAGDTIERIDLKDLLNPVDGKAEFITNIDASQLGSLSEPLGDFFPLTDSNINASSPNADWSVNSIEGRIEQSNRVRGGGVTDTQPRKAGAQLLLRPGGTPKPLQNFVLGFDFDADNRHGIGCVFRWQDSENYYYFLVSEARDFQIFGKKIDGSWSFLEVEGRANLDYIDFSVPQRLEVVVLENMFFAYLNQSLICEGQDSSLTDAGEVGLLTHNNNAAHFYAIDLVKLKT